VPDPRQSRLRHIAEPVTDVRSIGIDFRSVIELDRSPEIARLTSASQKAARNSRVKSKKGEEPMLALTHKSLNRRKILMMGAMAPILAPIFAPAVLRAASAEFIYKFATGQDPTHPVNIRLSEAFDRIRDKAGGKLDIKLFPANQLGTETNVISQIRNGGLEFTILSASILATLVPVSGIANTAYAFNNYDDVWKAMDGTLGKYIQAQVSKAGLVPNARIWDNGFRQCTSSTRDLRAPEDFV
jgi:TRAP-type C4-dicarboxylate transport system substrate-binding protein